MIRGKKEGSNYSTWFIGFDHGSNPEEQTGSIGGGPPAPGLPATPPPHYHSPGVVGRAGGPGGRPMSTTSSGAENGHLPHHLTRAAPSTSSSSLSLPSPHAKQLRPRTPEPSRRGLRPARDGDKKLSSSSAAAAGSSGSVVGGGGGPSLLRALPRWDEDRPERRKAKNVNEDLCKHVIESALKAEEKKFQVNFEEVLNDLHTALDRQDRQNSQGLMDGLSSTPYGEVVLAFQGKIKQLLGNLNRRLQRAYESFNNQDDSEDHNQQVKQNMSRLLEDLIGESLDVTSDEAVSDLSSVSDDSPIDRNAFHDQLAQSVVSKILETHRREVHHGLRRLSDSSSLIPEALHDDDDDDNDNRLSHRRNVAPVKDTDISKDFKDLKHFVEETQSHSRRYDNPSYGVDSVDGDEGVTDFRGGGIGSRLSSGFDVGGADIESEFSDLQQVFDSNLDIEEVDPDLLQMNLWVIPEETEEEVEEEAKDDSQWRENWIFKGQGGPSPAGQGDRRRIRGQDDQPQYMMVPQPDEGLAPRVGNRDVDQLSDLSDAAEDAENLTDDDSASFYPGTSEEVARLSRYKHSSSPPTLRSASLIPSPTDELDTNQNHLEEDFPPPLPRELHKKNTTASLPAYDGDLDFDDVDVGTDAADFVGPIVQPTQKELKLLDSLVPADEDDPKFVEMPESVTIQEGEPVKFSCRVSGTQPIDVFWYREQAEVEELEEGEDIEMQEEREGEGGDRRHSATLYHVGKQHAGQYMCIALSDKGKAIKYLTVTVKDSKQELKKPEFLKELNDVEVPEGRSVKFRCKVKGYPQPRIYWYKDGSLLRSTKSCKLEKFGNRDYLLTMDQVSMDDDAEYMVVAKNVAGQVKSVAQVIVEPHSEGQSLPPPPPAVVTTRTGQTASAPQETAAVPLKPGQPGSEVVVLTGDSGTGKTPLRSSSGGSRMDGKVDTLLVTQEELSDVNQCLDDMERYLGVEEYESPRVPDDGSPPCVEDGSEMDKTTTNARRLTPNTRRVLQAAEEIIQRERNPPADTSSSSAHLPLLQTSRITGGSSSSSSQRVAPQPRPSPIEQNDLTVSVSSGYGSSSVTSSPLDNPDSDGGMGAGSPPPSRSDPRDDFALHLPPLGDDGGSGSYREEVSFNLSAKNAGGKPKNGTPSRASSTMAPPSGTETQSSRRTLTTKSTSPPSSTDTSGSGSSLVPSAPKRSLSHREAAGTARDEAGALLRMREPASAPSGAPNLVLNFGPKEISPAAYGRDYEVRGRGEEKGEQKRWSVTLDPYLPSADVVNRRPPVDEAEDKVSDIGTPQISPRSSRGDGSSSSTISTSGESLDSGVSCSAPFSYERPLPVHMVGETREEEVPESRAEYDADSGIELPSVSRLKAMFGSSDGGKGSPGEGSSFRRIHSITARSLSREQLQRLREDSNSAHPTRDSRVQSRSALQLSSPSSPPPSHSGRATPPGSTPSTVRTATSSRQQHAPEQARRETGAPVARQRVQTLNVLEFAQQDSSSGSDGGGVVFPDQEPRRSALNRTAAAASNFSRSRANSPAPRPRSAILEGQGLSKPGPVVPRPRVQSNTSEAAGSSGAACRPKIRSGGISARAAFWERRIQQGEGAEDENIESNFPHTADSHS